MRRTRIAAATVMVAAGLIGAVAAPATGKTRHLAGAFEGEPGSSVSMTVKLNNKGRPKFVKNIVISGLNMLCDDDESNIPTPRKLGPLEIPGKLRVTYDGFGKLFKNIDEDLSHFSFSGTLLKKGKQAVGSVETFAGTRCSVLAYYLVKKA